MRLPGFIGQSYTSTSVNYDCQRCINLYPEIDEIQTGKEHEVACLVGTPGNSLLASIGIGPIRGIWYTSTGVLYVVSGYTVYSVNAQWTATSVGTILTAHGQVSMADNGLQLFIVDGANGYYVTLPGGTVTRVTDINFQGSNIVQFQDGYFIFAVPKSKEIYLSDLNAITFTAPANSDRNGGPDNITTIASVNRNLWLFGDQTTEVWFNTGDNLNPFQYIQGSLMQYGCASTFGIAKLGNSIFFLGKDPNGKGIVFATNGYQAQRVSTTAVEVAMQKYSTLSDAQAFAYQEAGHNFFVLTFPSGNATWVYDTSTQMWHERAYNNNGTLTRIRANCHAFAYETHVVGDYANGNIYAQNINTYSDNGTAIIRQRVSPHVSSDMKRIFYSGFQLDFESGTGLDGSGQGTNPQAILQWSDDGGHTWSNENWAAMGAIGQTRARAIWRRLGRSRNRVFKVTVSDPVKNVWIGAEVDLELGES